MTMASSNPDHDKFVKDYCNREWPPRLSNTEILCFILGWQGGTIHQVATELGVSNSLILDANYPTMQWLSRMCQTRGVHRKSPRILGRE